MQIVDLERWAMELEMRWRKRIGIRRGWRDAGHYEGDYGMLKGMTKIRAATMDSDGLRRGKKGRWRLRRGWRIW